MYGILTRYLPPPIATIATGLWYALLGWAIFFCLQADSAAFRYWWI